MSMENAILELAAAIRYAADKTAGGTGKIAKLIENVTSSGPLAVDTIEADVTRVEQDAKAAQQKAMDKVEAERKPSAAKAEIAAALAKAKAEKDAAQNKADDAQKAAALQAKIDADRAAAAELDYEKDVKPKLLAVGKDKGAFVALLADFGVGKDLKYAKADQLPKSEYPALVTQADAILLARG